MESEQLEAIEACLPSWLERYAFYEEDRARAYDAVSPQVRARLKKTVARLHSIYGTRPRQHEMRQVFDAFTFRCLRSPVPCTFVCLPEKYPFPQCLMAALVPPLLAGVGLVVPFFINAEGEISVHREAGTVPDIACALAPVAAGPTEAQNALLAALDLAGLERAFRLPASECLDALAEFFSSLPPVLSGTGESAFGRGPAMSFGGVGRIVLLGSFAGWEAIALFAARHGIPCAILTDEPGLAPVEWPDQAAHALPFALQPLLDAENREIWLWPHLEPEFFLTNRVYIGKPE